MKQSGAGQNMSGDGAVCDKPQISVVIPVYGPGPHLEQVIRALQEQSYPPCEVIIGHSGDGDPTVRLKKYEPFVKVVHSATRMYAGAARNLAVDRATGSWIAFFDEDIVPDSGCLEAFVAAAAKYPDRHFFGGSIGYARSGGYWGLCMWMMEFSSQHVYMPERHASTLASCNMFIRRSDFLGIGGFASGVQIGEDSQLQLRLAREGYKLVFFPAAFGRHFNIPGFRYFARHVGPLGRAAAVLRKRYNYRGSIFAKVPPLVALLPFLRIGQMALRVIRWKPAFILRFIVLSPGVMFGLMLWSVSFFLASLNEESN